MKSHRENERIKQKFKVAFEGLFYAVRKDRSVRIQFILALIAIVFFLLLGISLSDWLFVLIAIGLVIISELFNTAVELICDSISPQDDLKMKRIKDIAAGAVLFSALIALLIGIILIIKVGGNI